MKDKILQAAVQLFRRNGIRSVTMDMVAAEAGISKRTLYEYYPAKDALVEACLNLELERRRQMASKILATSHHLVETYIMFMWNYIAELRRTHPLFMQDIRRLYPGTLCQQAADFELHLKEKVSDFVRQGQQEGIFVTNLNPELSAVILFQQIKMLTENGEQVFPPEKYPPHEVFAHIAIHFIRGIATPRGLEIIDHYYQLHNPDLKINVE
ncbi:MAG: TetR/AcrR family transcriptional regulator [Bacteroidales bacterium]